MNPEQSVRCGAIPGGEAQRMAEVIDSGFGQGLSVFIPERARRLQVLAAGVNREAALGAYLGGALAGVTGLKTSAGSVYDDMTFALLRSYLGSGAIRARLAVRLLDRPLKPGTIRIEFIAVEEYARGRGVAGAMLEAVEQLACNQGAQRLELHVEPENTTALALYERFGFVEAPGEVESRMRRMLAPQNDRRMIKELECTTS